MKKTWKNTKTQLEKLPELIGPVCNEKGCRKWLGGSFLKDGSPIITVAKTTKAVARILLEKKLKRPIKKGQLACHSCDHRWCVEKFHLWEGTYQDNVDDMISKNRQAKGEHAGSAKLTESKVRQIRTSSLPQRTLARRYGVARSLIFRIQKRMVWRHVI